MVGTCMLYKTIALRFQLAKDRSLKKNGTRKYTQLFMINLLFSKH